MNLRWQQFELPLRARLTPLDARRRAPFLKRWFILFFDAVAYGFLTYRFEDFPRWLIMTSRASVTLAFLATCFAINIIPHYKDSLAGAILTATELWALVFAWTRINYCLDLAECDSIHRVLWMFPVRLDRIFLRFFGQIAFGHICLFLEFAFAYCVVVADRAPTPVPLRGRPSLRPPAIRLFAGADSPDAEMEGKRGVAFL